jgi:Tfp pilus assembly protein PilF
MMRARHMGVLFIFKFRMLLFLIPVLTVLTGCVTGGKGKPEAALPEAPAAGKPTVTGLADGRQGFVITEVPRMDEAGRREFEHAIALLNEQAYDPAADILEKIIAQSPGVTAPYINLAIAYVHKGEPEKAETHLKSALAMVPGHPAASNEYGLLHRNAGRFTEAREVYETSLAQFPDYYPIHRNLGILCDLYLNDTACALAHYQICSEARPGDEQVKMWIADLRNRMRSN